VSTNIENVVIGPVHSKIISLQGEPLKIKREETAEYIAHSETRNYYVY